MSEDLAGTSNDSRAGEQAVEGNRPTPSRSPRYIGRVASLTPGNGAWKAECVILERHGKRREADKVVRKVTINIPLASYHEMLHYLDAALDKECQT